MPGSCGWFPLPHEEIVAWVESHADELPGTLAQLSTYPIAFRRIIVNHVSHDRRTKLWQEHLRSFLGPQSQLSPDQRAFVKATIGALPTLFAQPLVQVQAAMKPLEEQMRALLTREQAAAMFGMLGPPEPPEGLPLPAGTRLTPVG